jgi:hypothetical protein
MKKLLSICFACISILALICPAYADLNDGLVGYWKFDDPSNLGLDSSGNGNNGTAYNATSVDGKIGTALEFSGNLDSYVEVPPNDSLNPTDALTISLWAKELSPSPAYSAMIYKAGELPTGWCADRGRWTQSIGQPDRAVKL